MNDNHIHAMCVHIYKNYLDYIKYDWNDYTVYNAYKCYHAKNSAIIFFKFIKNENLNVTYAR